MVMEEGNTKTKFKVTKSRINIAKMIEESV